jgi:hypothetical protein
MKKKIKRIRDRELIQRIIRMIPIKTLGAIRIRFNLIVSCAQMTILRTNALLLGKLRSC